jgi:hypothetical protein
MRARTRIIRALLRFALALHLVGAETVAAETADPATQKTAEDKFDWTSDGDIAFVERFQQAIREDDRQWIVEHTKIGFALFVRGKKTTMHSQAEFTRHFDEIYTPAVRDAILANPLQELRTSWRSLLFLSGPNDSPLITIAVSCARRPIGCKEETYEINSVTR